MKDKIFLILITIFSVFFLVAAESVTTTTNLGDPVIGKEIYESQGCGACHRINGLGGTIGPDLSKIFEKSDDYIRESIFEPGKVIAKGYKNVMPSYKGVLTESDVDNIIVYFKSLNKKKKSIKKNK